MPYLITQSLISAWQYMFDCFPGCEDDAKASFLATLNRERTEQTTAMLNGIEFETEVYKAAAGVPREPHPAWESGIQLIAPIIAGGQYQVKASREIEVDGMTFLAYGILDALKAGSISDVKFKSKSFGSVELAGSYLDSPQHPMYFYLVPEAHEFTYLVSDGDDLYTERYTPEETRPLTDIIHEFIASLTEMGLLETYKEKWRAA